MLKMSDTEQLKSTLNEGQTKSNAQVGDDSSLDIENIFDQSNEIDCDKDFANKQYDKYVENFYNAGYREALSFVEDEAGADTFNSEEHALQLAFDKGYETAFITAKNISILANAVRTHLVFIRNNSDPLLQANLHELESLNLELDLAKIKLEEVVGSSSIAENNKSDKIFTVKQRIVKIDDEWSSKLSDTINLPDLQKKCKVLLDIDV